MDIVTVERLDHLGIIAGVIKDLHLIEMIDARLGLDDQEDITTGEAVAGMILNGLGFSDRPMSLTPQFFANRPVALLFRDGVSAEHFNRFKLGRSLDKTFSYGCDTLFSEVAMAVCQQEGIALQFTSLDTTSFSLTGAYVPETDTQAIAITYGYSKDHRPDLKQAVLELMVTQDGGVPFLSQSWDGNASDTVVFKERCEALITQFAASEPPRYLIADAKLYTEANAPNLARLPFITRIPETLTVTQQVIEQAWAGGAWQPLNETVNYQRVELCHYGMAQRWLVVSSQDAWQRAAQTLAKAQAKASEQVQKQLFHLQAQRFPSETTARAALETIAQRWRYHQIAQVALTPHIQYARKGRPTPQTPQKAIQWQIHASVMPDFAKLTRQQQRKACFVLGTTSCHRPDRWGGGGGLQRAKRGGAWVSLSQGPRVFCLVALHQKAVSAPRSLDGDDPGVVGLLRRPTPDATPVGTSTHHPSQPDRAARVPTNASLGLPTLGGHQSCDLCCARAHPNSH